MGFWGSNVAKKRTRMAMDFHLDHEPGQPASAPFSAPTSTDAPSPAEPEVPLQREMASTESASERLNGVPAAPLVSNPDPAAPPPAPLVESEPQLVSGTTVP